MQQSTKSEICFVVPPFDSLEFAPLGAAVIIGACRKRGFAVDAVFGSVLLAARMGYDLYHAVSTVSVKKLTGEYLFRTHAYAPEVAATLPDGPAQPKMRELFAAAQPAIRPHLDEVVAAIAAKQPRIVAITNNFQQNMAAFAIARRVRQELPQAVIVMGGSNVAGEMSNGLAKVFDTVDYFFDGEADIVFPEFCERYLHHGELPAKPVVSCAPVQNVNVVSEADFSDFVAALGIEQRAGRLPNRLPDHPTFEASRGCWWGAKHHCTFCGLNSKGMQFREKSADRVTDELRAIESIWPGREIHVADSILPMSFFDSVLPRLAASTPRPKLFYEVKANLKVSQLATMLAGGIYGVQTGIESLSSPILKLMRKGVTAHQNLALLRDCAAVGVQAGWNFIYGFPGETADNYRDVLALLPAVAHLTPPKGFSPIMIDRFSPYFDNHDSFGIPSLRPFDACLGLYPPDAPIHEIAYHFNGDYTTPLLSDTGLLEEFRTEVLAWQALWRGPAKRPMLHGDWRPSGSAVIIDTRPIAREHLTVLPASAAQALIHLERPRALAALPDFVQSDLDLLLARRFVVDYEGVLVSVVVRKHVSSVPDGRAAEASAAGDVARVEARSAGA